MRAVRHHGVYGIGAALLILIWLMVCLDGAPAQAKSKKKKKPLQQEKIESSDEENLSQDPPHDDEDSEKKNGDSDETDDSGEEENDPDADSVNRDSADSDVDRADDADEARRREREIAEKSAEIQKNFQERKSYLCPVCGASEPNLGDCSQCNTPLIDASDPLDAAGQP